MKGFAAGSLVLVVAIAVAGTARVRVESRLPERSVEEELLYLPNGRYLKAVSLGHASLMADAIYLWAIQRYSDYENRGRYEYVEHIFGQVIPELDPHYQDPYWLGALILSIEAQDLEAGLRLLDQGFATNPHAWILPYMAGWECHAAGDYRRAADYFRQASTVDGAPDFVERLQAGMIQRTGDRSQALDAWRQVLASPKGDERTRAIAERQIRRLLSHPSVVLGDG